MKQTLLLLFMFIALSCTKKTEENQISEIETEEEKKEFIFTGHGISFTTDDYENWRTVYKEKTNDLDMIGIYQSMEEENVYVVFERNEGHKEAQRFLQSRNFKKMSKDLGSKTTQIIYFNVKEINGGLSIPYALGVTHQITDWEKWNEHWSTAREMHEKSGMKVAATSIDANNENIFYIWIAVEDMEAAKSFMNSHHSQNQNSMSDYGVKGIPNSSWWKTVERKY